VEAREEIGVLLLLHDLLELERKPANSDLSRISSIDWTKLLLASGFMIQNILQATSKGETTVVFKYPP
jgi:hypothetical protein